MAFQWSTHKISSILHVVPKGSAVNDNPVFITTDSRMVQPGAVFVAIKGDHFDGHQFIDQAIAKGAAAILTEKSVANPSQAAIFEVQSTLQSIRKLAGAYRESFKIPFVGIVGAVGKTTTKELLASLLQGKYKNVFKTEGSLNGFLGIPITLLGLKSEHEIAVIEIGIDEIGAMEQHLALVQPTHLILTANGPEHLHQLRTVEIAASEELKALDYALDHEKPMALNLSDEYVLRWFDKHASVVKRETYVTYALREGIPSSIHPDFLGDSEPDSNLLHVTTPGLILTLPTPIPGVHHAHNLLAAVAVASFFPMSAEQILKGLKNFKTAFGRTEIYSLPNGAEIIGDYYNSNPTSMKAALQLLLARTGEEGASLAVLGDMLELGNDEERFHRELAPMLRAAKVQSVWLYGARMKWLLDEMKKHEFCEVQHFETHELLVSALKGAIKSGAHVLIKGSRGMRMEKVLESLLGKPVTK